MPRNGQRTTDNGQILNIASYLPLMAKKQPSEPAIFFPQGKDKNGEVNYTHYTFKQLDQESDYIARGLEKSGIGRGVRTVLMVPPSPDFFSLTFAMFKVGAVPVMIDPGIGIRNIKDCLAQAEPEAFIGIPKAHLARILLGWGRATIRINITAGRRLFWKGTTLVRIRKTGEAENSYEMAQTREDDTAAILFTSGSTGPPKGAVYTHGNFTAQVEIIRNTFQIEPGEIDLPTFPLFALFDPALGMTTVIPDMDPTRPALVDPENIIGPIHKFNITNMFGSPALLNRVGRYGAECGIKCPTLRRVISAGAPASTLVLERFSQMLSPDSQIFTPYGATEAMPVSSIGSHEILQETKHLTDEGKGVCVGKPVNEMTVAVISITDDIVAEWDDGLKLPQSHIGEIVVKGPTATPAYYKKETATRFAKIYEKDGNGFWHRMGDLGMFDEQGRLWFCGRKTHRVITKSGTLYTIPCEAVFNTHPKVYRTALVGVEINGETEPVICVELEEVSTVANLETIKEELLTLGHSRPHTKDIKEILFHHGFPVDIRHNAKIFREKLAIWAEKRLPPSKRCSK
ncbi:MAG: AMP-binding protein [Deltaproteobacteria bacterium]|nr:AMP-binding protein [Deltaproteobacteria bacterium]